MPSSIALRRCPELIFAPARFDVYRNVSKQIREIFRHYSDLVEPLSLDEAYLDVTDDKQCVGSAVHTAQRVRAAIKEQTGLTASAGVSYNKFLAKIASDQNKPDGIFVIRPAEGADFVTTLPVRRFYGVGPRTAERMASQGIHLGGDLRAKDMDYLYQHFGKSANYLYHASRGIDHREVKTNRVRKSVGRETTYKEDLKTEAQLRGALVAVIDSVWQRIEDNGATGRTVTLKVKYADFRQITRSQSGYDVIAGKAAFAGIANQLLGQVLPVSMGVRLLGLTLSSLTPEIGSAKPEQTPLQIAEQGVFEF
jgi:DNA polymerase-4